MNIRNKPSLSCLESMETDRILEELGFKKRNKRMRCDNFALKEAKRIKRELGFKFKEMNEK
jgi:hypothetical protein